jgi:muramoyltetrapeptide carboxypeptidase
MWAFIDKSIDAIMTLRGGYGSARILNKIDYKFISKHKKPLFGFSDATALQLALWKKSKLVSYSGLQASFLQDKIDTGLNTTFEAMLAGKKISWQGLTPLTKGKATGRLIGGTLTLITSLIGTPYEPDFKKAILVLEDIGEEPYRVDRMLTQMHLAGVFDKISGVVLGDWHNCTAKNKNDGTIETVLMEHFGNLPIPVVKGFPYGHGIKGTIFPIGAKAKLNADKGSLVQL